MAQYIVVREFKDETGRLLQIGETVDADGWRNVETMVRSRYLRRVAGTEPEQARFGVVCREFSHNGQPLTIGTVVDLSGWRNVETLLAARYIRAATEADYGPTPPLVLGPDPHAGLDVAGTARPREKRGRAHAGHAAR